MVNPLYHSHAYISEPGPIIYVPKYGIRRPNVGTVLNFMVDIFLWLSLNSYNLLLKKNKLPRMAEMISQNIAVH